MRPLPILGLVLVMTLSGCLPPQPRMGMVVEPETGLLYGSTIEASLVTDPSFYSNRKIKIRTRNTSGDVAFGLDTFTDDLRVAYAEKGYEPSLAEDFGLMLDLNVLYSGQAQTSAAQSFGFLAGAVGGVYGAKTGKLEGPLLGSIAGASLGAIAGSYVTDDTYMIVAHVTFGVVKKAKRSRKRVTFSRSEKLKNIDDPDEEDEVYARGFKKTYSTHLAVYAGGRNVTQKEIVDGVKARMVRILSDFI